VLTGRTGDSALRRAAHRGDESSQLIFGSHNDPVSASPEQEGTAATGTTGKIVQVLEADDDMASPPQRQRQSDQGQIPLQSSGSLPYRQARLQLHDDRVET
jgi:hypothetical protein